MGCSMQTLIKLILVNGVNVFELVFVPDMTYSTLSVTFGLCIR